ncbi:MAG: glycoside hydrolase family 3 protein, partial [Candidatus Sumerlaeota bacterium]
MSRLEQKDMSKMQKYDEIIAAMSRKEKLFHVLSPRVPKGSDEEIAEYLEKYPLGCAYIGEGNATEVGQITARYQKFSRRPILFNMDIVWGPGKVLKDECTFFPAPMAVGAADREDLTYQLGQATAMQGRERGIHMTLAPIADINLNIKSPIVNMRAFGDDFRHVLKHSSAFMRGVQDTGLMAATAKHFPGDGVDDKDQHYVTSINSLSREEWFEQFGFVYSNLIEQGLDAVMSGHIALPWRHPAEEGSHLGPPPASLSPIILNELLRKELGFDGVIITDAMDMVGCVAHVPREELAFHLLSAGNDILLFADEEVDYACLERALEDGRLSEERLHDAIRRILRLKDKLGILDETADYQMPEGKKEAHDKAAEEMAENSICVVRDVDNILPLPLEKGDKVLSVALRYGRNDPKFEYASDLIVKELEKRGLDVDFILNPELKDLRPIADRYKAIFMTINVGPQGREGTILIKDVTLWAFWDYVFIRHPRCVVSSLGD